MKKPYKKPYVLISSSNGNLCEKKYRANSHFISREIAGEFILVPIGPMALKIHGMIALSESGQLLWGKLQNDCTEQELLEALMKEYEVDQDTAREDVRAFLNEMELLGILK